LGGFEHKRENQLLYNTIVHEANRRTKRSERTGGYSLVESRAVLLFGPPGTGKSQLADCVATEAPGCVFIKATGDQLLAKYLGQSEKNINLLFEMAHDLSPAIIFFDECDSVFGKRKGSSESSNTSSSIAASLLTLMATYTDIRIIATTNLPWDLDPAFLRRFNTRCLLDMPTQKEKEVMLKYCLRTLFIQMTELEYQYLAKELVGYSGSDLRSLNSAIYDFLNHMESGCRYFKMCHLRKDAIVPCFSNDKDPSKIKSHFKKFSEGDLKSPVLTYNDVRSIKKHHSTKTNDTDLVKNLREYAKNPEGGDPAKKKDKQQYVYNPAPQYPPQGYRPSYTGNFGNNGYY
jgi:ATPase family associated with various cellular activities (AAA)